MPFQITPLYLSTRPLPVGLYGVVRLVDTPFEVRNSRSSQLMEEAPLSEWMKAGIQQTVNSDVNALTTLSVDKSRHGNTNGNREYSSTTVRKYSFWLLLGRGPLKSILSFSNDCVALTRRPGSG